MDVTEFNVHWFYEIYQPFASISLQPRTRILILFLWTETRKSCDLLHYFMAVYIQNQNRMFGIVISYYLEETDASHVANI